MVTAASVTSDKNSASICEEATFTVTTAPEGYSDLIQWTGGGCPASQNGGATFTTNWLCLGWKEVTASCCGNLASKDFPVVAVDKVVKQGTDDEGPLYPGCPGSSVTLEAKPNPEGAPFPDGEPHWTLQKPDGSSASLSASTGSVTTLSGTNKFGQYIVTAKCCESDEGDSISVVFNLINESQYSYYYREWGEVPSSCWPVNCNGEDSYELDDCGNEIEFSCCQSDGSGGATGCAYRVFYNNTLLSSCVFPVMPYNDVYRRIATIEGTSLQYFTKIKHINQNGSKYVGGCWGYYCTKFYTYDCLTGASSTVWRRDPDNPPLKEDDGESCPGH